jgi:hypothetical protein
MARVQIPTKVVSEQEALSQKVETGWRELPIEESKRLGDATDRATGHERGHLTSSKPVAS